MEKCFYCSADRARYLSVDGESLICRDCAIREIRELFPDLEPENWGRLRRRLEDAIRKSPALLADCVAQAVVDGYIRIDDLI